MSHIPLRDTPLAYGLITRGFHWVITALILWQFLGMGLRAIFGRQPFVSFFTGSHQQVGTALFVLIVLRVLWALASRANRPRHTDNPVGVAARLGHLALYGLMLLVPAVALLRAWGSDRVFAPFGFQIFPAQEPAIVWTGKLAGWLHGELGWVLMALILGHVLMVGVHEHKWRDGTLSRMLGRPDQPVSRG